ncbi:glycosyltransferase family 4 protein [Nesterenkonia sp. MY13]|uniref:Glycosyltransferase family 4 protein n=1 Tax=Nesterenkonia sedimenti TaxID=1463632 RepID=A0A7X8TNA6_9MICC|nr:glycosyltransferase [Nesterenkonia sedimenti]NLS11158.1 glycosyltransferase family 4 protein [Nesterenkonia sedimenti]
MAPTPVVGYVLKMYPRFSETFIVSEILAREAAGERVVIFSLRTPTDTRFHSELGKVKAPVIQIPRTSNAAKMWARMGEAGQAAGLGEGIQSVIPELLATEADNAFQSVMLAKAANDHGVTHLHAHFASVSTTVARLAGAIAGIPYSFTAHAKDIFHEDVDQAELERKFADAHHSVTISEYNLRDLQRRFPAATENLHLVRNGLNLERFPYEPRTNTRAVPRILAVGRLVEKKGFGLLIEAVAALRDRGIRVQADIAGDGPLAAALETQIAELDLQDQVHLLGPRTQAEVTALMGSHDVFAAPFVIGSDGNADGLPTVLLEAMARGIRCVAAEVTAVGEVIRHRETGWLVPTGDMPALTEALAEAVRPGDHSPLTDAARSLVQEQFDSNRQAGQLRQLCSPTGADSTENHQETVSTTPAEVMQ